MATDIRDIKDFGTHDPNNAPRGTAEPITAGDDYTQPELKFYDRDFAKMYENNPALQYQYTPSFWDRLFRNTAFKTKEKAWIDEQRNNALNYGADLQELDRQQEYNNAVNQAQRERDAGLNPNLDPSSISPGEASENDNATLPEQTKRETDLETTRDTLNVVTSALGFVNNTFISALTMLKSGTGIFNEMVKTNTEGREKVYNLMKQIMEGHLSNTEEGWVRDLPFYEWNADTETMGTNRQSFMNNEWVKDNFPTLRERKWAWSAYRELYDNLQTLTKGNKNYEDLVTGEIELGKALQTRKEWGTSISGIMKSYEPIARFQKEMASILAEAGVDEGNYRRDYWKNASGSNRAQAENAQYGYNYEYWSEKDGQIQAQGENKKAEIMSAVTGAFSDMIQDYANKASDPKRPWYEKMLYITIMKFFADLDNTNTVQSGMGLVSNALTR